MIYFLRTLLSIILVIHLTTLYGQKETIELSLGMNSTSEIHTASQNQESFTSARSLLDTQIEVLFQMRSMRLKFFSNIGFIAGSSISERIGDLYLASSIDAQNAIRMQNLWLGAENKAETIEIRIGNQAVDDMFIVSDRSNYFIHGAAAYVFTFSMNAPQWPVASLGFYSRVQLNPYEKIHFGVYGSDPNVTNESIKSNKFSIRTSYEGALKIIEWEKSKGNNLLKLGFFSDNNRFGFSPVSESSLNALYAVKEGILSSNQSQTKISYHLAASKALDAKTAPIIYDLRAGLFFKPLNWRNEMTFALGYFYPRINTKQLEQFNLISESFGELSAKYPLSSKATIQVSAQYIEGAGALNGYNSDPSILGVFRLHLSL